MSVRSFYQNIKVLDCFKLKRELDKKGDELPQKWLVKHLKAFDLFRDRNKEFKDTSFEVKKLVSSIPLKKGDNCVLLRVEEDVEEDEDGNCSLTQEIISSVVEYYDPSIDGLGLTSDHKYRKADKVKPEEFFEIPPSTLTSFKFETSCLELDYLTANASLPNYNVEKTRDRRIVKDHFLRMGLELVTDNVNNMHFENKEIGIFASFQNFKDNKIEYGFNPSVRITFSGHYFIRENADLVARKTMIAFTQKFGAMFSISRVDIRRDIYGAYAPFDYFPNFLDRKKHPWSLRSEPDKAIYHNGLTSDGTGFSVSTSRYNIKSYNRNISLEKKYAKGKLTKEYYDHYVNLYDGRDVQRLEVSLTQKDSCSFFCKVFFHETYNKQRALVYTMANFGRNHVLRDFEEGVENQDVK